MTADPFYFDEKAATIVERFFDRMLVHIEGPMAGRPFILEPWQRRIVRNLFGWKQGEITWSGEETAAVPNVVRSLDSLILDGLRQAVQVAAYSPPRRR